MATIDLVEGVSDYRVATATLLTLLVPGLGHVYLRRFRRAAAWLALALAAGVLAAPDLVVAAATGSPVSVAAAASPETLRTVLLAAVAVRALGSVDAVATIRTAAAGDGAVCPDCNRAVDEDLSFCHWCLASIESVTHD